VVFKDNFVVTIKCKGKILREKDRSVYLPFGSEYSILMKNLSERRALVDVEIDGESVIQGKLIIDANSSMELERYVKDLNVGNRFKFIEKTDKISEYRGDRVDDGILRVTYQFEKPYTPPVMTYNYRYCGHFGSSCPYSYLTSCYGCINYKTYSTTGKPLVYWSTYSSTSECSVSDGVEVICNNTDIDTMSFCEEGITVPGSSSEQKFNVGFIGDLEEETHVITLQLKGLEEKEGLPKPEPLTVQTKVTCITCGLRQSSRFNYCSECGTALTVF